MPNQNLKQIIRELGDGLSFLPEDEIAEVITNVVEELLPLAIFSMNDDSIKIDDSRLSQEEYHERRTWGKERRDLEDMIGQKRELLEHVRIVKSSTENIRIADHGSLLMMKPQTAIAYAPVMKQSSQNMGIEYSYTNYSSESLEKKYSLREKDIQFTVDNSLLNKLNDGLFVKFCSTIEKTSRYFAKTHTIGFIFTLKERKDVELPDWQRIVLYVRFPRIPFETADLLWSTLSNETRNELNKTLKQLTATDHEKFVNLIKNFNVEMDY